MKFLRETPVNNSDDDFPPGDGGVNPLPPQFATAAEALAAAEAISWQTEMLQQEITGIAQSGRYEPQAALQKILITLDTRAAEAVEDHLNAGKVYLSERSQNER
jgi:hypothetical protein